MFPITNLEIIMASFEDLKSAIIKGKRDDVTALVKEFLDANTDINNILDEGMIPAMREIGDRFSRNEAYVPELLIAARAMQAGLEMIEPLLEEAGRESLGTIAIGTVKGDLHDIGKNLVAMLLKNHGFAVTDLGKDVSSEAIVDKAEEIDADIIGLSALITTTAKEMENVIKLAKQRNIRAKVMVGGAVVSEEYSKSIGADAYAADAAGAVKKAQMLVE